MNRIVVAMFLIAFGYASAVMVATLVAEGLMLVFGTVIGDPSWLPENPGFGSFAQIVIAGGMFTAFWGFPGFALAITLAALSRWRGRLVFTALGGGNAAFSLALFGIFAGTPSLPLESGFSLPCLAGGLAGGFVYWSVAGRFIPRREAMA